MNTVVDPGPSLLARLGTLVDCARAEGYACITARHEHGAHAVDIDHPCIAIFSAVASRSARMRRRWSSSPATCS